MNRLLRSVLYMPAANVRAMDKARSLPVDAVVFDLEDAVAPAMKDSAREQLLTQLATGGYGRRQLVARCNALASPWGRADLQALARSPVNTLCLPKVEAVEQLQEFSALLQSLQRSDMALWPMIETPAGVANVEAIAGYGGVTALVMGTTDLAAQLRLPTDPLRRGLHYALGRCVLAARLAGVAALDGVYLDLEDEPGLRQVCEQGRALGFDGKTLIHPRQIAVANAVFGPDAAAMEHARRLLDCWETAAADGKGVAVLDGKLIETMHVDEARRVLAMAEQARPGG
ncbi:HpcH/HpaI aldolase/citrate lyase family protein [Kineobactrum salinum]|uniref:CoA ester lyase n=1 Tax=Kineobactrum salinum TaxID=2708301 RepID=A0A6C0U5H5_9GAMM|nr:CoA ester lyase [Kineobactrum salinum]QIB66669.1 CoA ester lyase [Kineobactrum salinum]